MKKITKNCTGCSACKSCCPKNAIKFSNLLFPVATIDENKCIDCNICKKVCPSNKDKENNNVEIKVARIKSKKNIIKSTSGGMFGELARFILSKNGIVYGARFTNDYKAVEHTRCKTYEELESILKSKYVRSNIKNTYKEAEKDLKDGKIVLYSGTPCQIAGLKCFLRKEYENLYTIDIICHGTPSQKIWEKYVNYCEKKNTSKITHVDFRYYDKKIQQRIF